MSDENRIQAILPKVVQTVRTSSALAAQDVNFFKSIDKEISKRIEGSGEKLLSKINKFVSSALDAPVFIKTENDMSIPSSSWKEVSELLDSIFDKSDIALEKAKKDALSVINDTKSSNLTYLDESISGDHYRNSNNNAPKVMQKPQESFKNKVDNSENHPFKPKLTSKPHSLKSFEESVKMVHPVPKEDQDFVDPPFYSQPYEYEIDNQKYSDSVLEYSEPLAPEPWDQTSAIWVSSLGDLESMIKDLSEETEIAVDLEHHDYRSYYGIVCLMQISTRKKDWIVDTLVLRDDLQKLNIIFANPKILKVLHGAFMDIIWLQRDLGLYIVSLFDTYHASKKLGLPRFSLAYLLENFANFKTSKKYQLADWRIRPLSNAMLAYARADTHFLLYIYDQLKNKLLEQGSDKLQQVLYESRQVAKRRFEYTKFRPNVPNGKVSCPIMANNPKEPYRSIMAQYNVPSYKKNLVEALYNWRDLVARKEDESTRFVMPNQFLVSLLYLDEPITIQSVLSASNYAPELVRINASEIVTLINSIAQDTAENDWKLADQWISNNHESDEFNAQNMTSEKAALSSKLFQDILSKMSTDTAFSQSSNFHSSSKLSNLMNLSDIFSVEIDFKDKKIIKHDYEEIAANRILLVEDSFENLRTHKIKLSHKVKDHERADKGSKEEHLNNLTEQNVKPEPEEKKADPNEIITLKKRNRSDFHAKSKSSPSQPSEPFNYKENGPLLTPRHQTTKNKKKKSFELFKDTTEIPVPQKKRKLNAGKTITFKRKP